MIALPKAAGKNVSMIDRTTATSLVLVFASMLSACSPRLEVSPPSEPITINLNVKIDHEVRVKVEKELDEVLSKDSELF